LAKFVTEDSWLKKSVRWFVEILGKKWSIYFVNPFILGTVPSTLTVLATNQSVRNSVVEYLPPIVSNFLSLNPFWVIVGSGILVIIIRGVFSLLKDYSLETSIIDTETMVNITNTLDEIVKNKYSRFSNKVIQLGSNPCPPGEIFTDITKPDQQILLLVAGLKKIFETIYKQQDAEIKANLMIIRKDIPVAWMVFLSKTDVQSTEPKELAEPQSSIMTAVKAKNVLIIDDIQSHIKEKNIKKKQFIKANTADDSQGSLICYPISCKTSNAVEYVLTISCNRKNCFKSSHKPLYMWLLPMFASRILVEHALLKLKEKAQCEIQTKKMDRAMEHPLG